MGHKPKILFLIPTLEPGGSQKVLSIVLKNLPEEKFEVVLCVLTGTGFFYDDLPDHITKIYLRTGRVRFSWLSIYKCIKQTNPSVVFVFDVNNLNLIVGAISLFLPSRIKYISRQAVILSAFFQNSGFANILRRSLYRATFKRFHAIICQSQHMMDDLINNFGVRPSVTILVNNPIEVDKVLKAAGEDKRTSDPIPSSSHIPELRLLALGRIVYVKGYDLLIEALSLVRSRDFHLTILGEKTPESPGYQESVIDLVKKYNLSHKVSFLGFSGNPYKYLKQSDLLIISSRTEAFSNAAIESNAVGTPVLAFDSPGGMAEIIKDGFNGWLVQNGNIKKLAEAIENINISQAVDRRAIADFTRRKYDVSKIIPQYEKVIFSLLNEKNARDI